jgi:chromosome segregation ATPase
MRAHEVARECAIVEEVVGRLRVEEQRLLSNMTALRAERQELERELATARDRLAAYESSIGLAESELVVKETELEAARDRLERQNELKRRGEREIDGYRSQLALAQQRLGELVVNVTRIQHKLLRKNASRRDDPG